MSATKLYPAAPLESGTVFEERLKKKLNDIIKLKNSIKNLEEMITHLRDQNRLSKKRNKNYEVLSSLISNRYFCFLFVATSSSLVNIN